MRQEVETSHKDDSVNAQLPVDFQHFFGLVDEHLGLRGSTGTSLFFEFFGSDEELRLGDKRANDSSEERKTSAEIEEGAPAVMSNDGEVDDGSKEVAHCVSLLEYAAGETAEFNGKVFEGIGRRETPDATHGDTKQGADSQELRESINEPSPEFEHATDNEVDDQGPFTTESIGEDTKDHSTNRSKQQGEGDGGGD